MTIVELEHDEQHGWRELVVEGRATVLGSDPYANDQQEKVLRTSGSVGFLGGDGRWWMIAVRCRYCGAGPHRAVRFSRFVEVLDALVVSGVYPLDNVPLNVVHRGLSRLR